MLDAKKKQAIIKKFATHDGDTGSANVQIAILTEEIYELTDHLKKHKKDFSSRRGLLRKVNLRRKLLKFLEREDPQNYEKIMKRLKIKKRSFLKKQALDLDEVDTSADDSDTKTDTDEKNEDDNQ